MIHGAQVAPQVGVIVILSALLTFYFLATAASCGHVLRRVRADVAPEIDAAGNRAFEVLGGYMIGTGAISFVGAASQLVIMVVLGSRSRCPCSSCRSSCASSRTSAASSRPGSPS